VVWNETNIASVRKSAMLVTSMKAFLAVVIFLAVAVSVHAQGQMVISGADVSTVFPASQNFGNQATESYWIITPLIPTLSPSGLSSGIGSVSQASSFAIQAVPEPSSFALLAVGLLAGAIIFRRSRTLARL
jgi:hypothetical protein